MSWSHKKLASDPVRGEEKPDIAPGDEYTFERNQNRCDSAAPASGGRRKGLRGSQPGSSSPRDLRRNRKRIKTWQASLDKFLRF